MKHPEIQASELQAVRDFLIGITDEVFLPTKPSKPSRPKHHIQTAVPVSNGITRARLRSARPQA